MCVRCLTDHWRKIVLGTAQEQTASWRAYNPKRWDSRRRWQQKEVTASYFSRITAKQSSKRWNGRKLNFSCQSWVRCTETWCPSSCYLYVQAPSLHTQVWRDLVQGSVSPRILGRWAAEVTSGWDTQESTLEAHTSTLTEPYLLSEVLHHSQAGFIGRGVCYLREEPTQLGWGCHCSRCLYTSQTLSSPRNILPGLALQQSHRQSWAPCAPFHIPSLINLY